MGKIFGVWIKTNTVLTRLKKNKIKKEINAFITIKCEYGLESHLFRIRGTPEIPKEMRDSIHTPAGVGAFGVMAVVVFLRMAKLGSKLLLGPYSMRQGAWFGVGRQVEVRLGLWQIAATVHLSRLL